ncbi:Hypothetical predicted protein [Paramuricea clavata]|uniref:Uncharacterized protein n=1 Tax=Paramuricea clavata TaxID=317549 RepID=A0A7D9HB41_PARCT|nr:Hypothetical predicted protein [Paramuricea clavata]
MVALGDHALLIKNLFGFEIVIEFHLYETLEYFSMMRDTPVRCFPKRAMEEDKRPRSFMTTSGMKTFRVLQPTVNNNALTKYQPRSRSPLQPQGHSTPLPPTKENDARSVKFRQSSASKRSTSPRSVGSSPKPPTLGSTCSSPVQYYRSTSGSYHTRAFTPRNLSCTPPHLYMADHVRKAAVQLHRAPSNSSRQTVSSNKTDTTLDSSEIPTRFGKPINLPTFVKTNPHLKNKELSMGQKQYLWGIARIYSMSRMKSQVQQQYQTLLNYEFKKRMQRLGISEREKIKEMKDYLRYKKFIKNYDQRIPRNLRSKDSAEERSNVADHIHRHVIKGWTTDVTSRGRYADESTETEVSVKEVESEGDWEEISERGAHIYKHVIKGWTMDPHANESFQRKFDGTELREKNDRKSESKSGENDDVAIYKVDFARSGGKGSIEGDVMKISRLYKESGQDKTLEGREPFEVIVQSAESNFL